MTVTEFVKQYHKAFVKAVKAYRISSENAEDLCQSRYVQWLQRAKPLEITKPERFIKYVARRVVMDYREKQNCQPPHISIDDIPDIPSTADTSTCGLIRDEEFAERYTSAKLEMQILGAFIQEYVLGKAKSDRVFDLLILYNSGATRREISTTIKMSTERVHNEIVQWRDWLSHVGES